MPVPFAHLHAHSDHSLLDGVGRSEEYAELAEAAGHSHLALTDHGNLSGLPAHWEACKAHGIKPIAGCELYVNDTRDQSKELWTKSTGGAGQADTGNDPTFVDNHLVVLAQTQQGWGNLLAINHDSVMNGYYYQPRTTHDFVCAHAEGLFATTACMGSAFGKLALQGDTPRLQALMGQFKQAFGQRFLCELHVNEIAEQLQINSVLLPMAKSMGVPIVLTSDVHYACMGESHRQDEMIAISRQTPLNDPKAFKLAARNLWFVGPDDLHRMAHQMGWPLTQADFYAAAQMAHDVAQSCVADIFPGSVLRPPRYIDSTNGLPVSDPFHTLMVKAAEGFKKLFDPRQMSPHDYKLRADQLRHELAVILKTGMSDFYLVTADVAEFCRHNGISVWTRGSGCASITALCCGITSVDPVRFNLLFERFVDPSRPNAPDFDLDINADRRHEVIEWLVKKYGGKDGERVARVCAIGTFGLKSALRDIVKAHGVGSHLATAASKAVDDLDPKLEQRLAVCKIADRQAVYTEVKQALAKSGSPLVLDLINQHPQVVDAALTMVGRVRNRGQHAAGYVVGPDALRNYIPIDNISGVVCSAWGEGQARQDIGPTGLMKIDLLALQTLAVLDSARADIAKHKGLTLAEVDTELSPLKLNFQDPLVAREYATGNGIGLHQLASLDQGLAKMVATMKPQRVEHVIAAIALYRPGSMDHVGDFLKRAAGTQPVPQVQAIFDQETAETFGVLVYQEQIMWVLHRIGGIAKRDGHYLIKAIGKKKLKDIIPKKAQFMAGAQQAGCSLQLAEGIFASIEKFAGYGFNKAHAVSYGVLSWITAYLRCYYPLEFWRGWLNQVPNEAGKDDGDRKIEHFLKAATGQGIELLPPDVQYSGPLWSYDPVKPRALRAPLSIIPGVGKGAAAMELARPPGGWKSLWEMLEWQDKNRRAFPTKGLYAMGCVGALNSLPGMTTARAVDLTKAYATLKTGKKQSAAAQLKGAVATSPGAILLTKPDPETYVALERVTLGFNHWQSPWFIENRITKVQELVAQGRIAPSTEKSLQDKRRAFYLNNIRHHTDKKGKTMAFLSLVTPDGDTVKGVCFASVWAKCADTVGSGRVYLVAGSYDKEGTYMVGGTENPIRDLDQVQGQPGSVI